MRERESEPIVTEPVGDCPAEFDDPQRQAWIDIVSTAPAGVLTRADRIAVEKAAQLLAISRQWIIVEDAVGNRYAARPITDGQSGHLFTLLGKFGMTPADRSKVSAVKAPQGNKFASIG